MSENKEAIQYRIVYPLQNKMRKEGYKSITGDEGLKFLENYKTQHLKLTVLLEKNLRENLKKHLDKLNGFIRRTGKLYRFQGYLKISKTHLSIVSCINNTGISPTI